MFGSCSSAANFSKGWARSPTPTVGSATSRARGWRNMQHTQDTNTSKNNYVPAYRAQSLVENTWKNDAKHKYINPWDWLKFHMVPKSLSKSLKVFKSPSKSLKVAQGRSRSLKVSQGLSRSLKVSQGLSGSLKVSHGIVFIRTKCCCKRERESRSPSHMFVLPVVREITVCFCHVTVLRIQTKQWFAFYSCVAKTLSI